MAQQAVQSISWIGLSYSKLGDRVIIGCDVSNDFFGVKSCGDESDLLINYNVKTNKRNHSRKRGLLSKVKKFVQIQGALSFISLRKSRIILTFVIRWNWLKLMPQLEIGQV